MHREEWRPSHIGRSLRDHTSLAVIRQSSDKPYNVIQKLSYIGVIFILLPLMIASGLTMSPTMDANWPFLSDLFGGRQSARSVHFLTAFLLVLFFLIHVVMVLLSGPVRQIQAMITGGHTKEAGR